MKKTTFFLLLVILPISSSYQQLFTQWATYELTELNAYPFDCFFINENTGWAGGAGLKVHFTSNAGVNWTLISAPGSSDRIETLFFVNSNTGWAGTFGGYVRKTTNGGYSWSQTAVVTNKNVLDIFFIDTNNGWLTGEDGLCKKTTDGGVNWYSATGFFPETGYSIYFINSQTGFAVGINNMAKSTNSGNNWQVIQKNGFYLYAINFLNQQTGWIVGSKVYFGSASGLYIMKTTNSGNNWNVICSDTATYGFHTIPTDAKFINENTGYFVGRSAFAPPPSSAHGIMRKSTNGGVSWSSVPGFYNDYSVESLCFVNSQTGFAVGLHSGYGVVYKTTNAIGINNIASEIPKSFSLSQNYPNPFNPETKIKFQIPAGSSVAQTFLSVFDILGKQVAVLVNQNLQPGTYEVNWNAADFPSGIYFYTLKSGDYTETRKMVLIK